VAISTLETVMPWYRMPNGDKVHINFGHAGNKKAPRPCGARRPDGTVCGWMAGYQCDWKTGAPYPNGEPEPTCDRHLCEAHAFEIDTDKHLCQEHVEAYRAWLREQCIAY